MTSGTALRTQAADIQTFRTPGLGDSSYLVVSGTEAVIVDPQRDAWRFIQAAQKQGVRIRAVLETHVHNDYLSGALELRDATLAEIVAPARGRYEFRHRAVEEGDFVEFGGHRLFCLETPGHTREHVAWQLTSVDDPQADPIAIFSGGSLLAGGAGRTDLTGPTHTAALTRAQFRSIRRLAALPAGVQLLPTHGGGSFCSGRSARTNDDAGAGSTIELERENNPLLQIDDSEVFSRSLLGALSVMPGYTTSIGAINRSGPRVLHEAPKPAALSPDDVVRVAASGAWIVDARDRLAFAAAHVNGAINVEATDSFAVYVGSVVPFDAPIVLITPAAPAVRADELALELARIGYDHVLGSLDGGMERWTGDGRAVVSYPAFPVGTLIAETPAPDGGMVLDVRQPAEWRGGVIPGSTTIALGDLPARVPEIAYSASHGAVVTVVCQGGARASVAASLLDRAGISVRLVASGGAPDWIAGHPEKLS